MRKSIILVALLMSITFVCSLGLETTYDSNIVVKELNNPVLIDAKISDAKSGTYNFYTLANVYLKPQDWFDITSGEESKTLYLTPNENFDYEGLYAFSYFLHYRNTGEKIEKKMSLKVIPLESVLEIGSQVTNLEENMITFYVENKENVELENLKAKFSSILFETEEEFSLGPNEKKEFTVEIDSDKFKTTKAGIYLINAEFDLDGEDVEILGKLYFGEKKGISTTEDKTGLLIRTTTIRKINTGNVLENVEISVNKNIISRLFTSFNIEPNKVERNGFSIEYTWLKEELEPSEIFTVNSKTNYLIPFIVLILAVLVIIGIKRYSQTKLEVLKSVLPVKTKNGEFALKIKLSIKSNKSVENVSLIDRIPAIVKIYKQFGTLKPDKIDAENRRIQWNIGDLNAGEERVFSYIVYSKVGVVGKFSLPSALAVFEKEGKIHEIESNQVFFLSDQIRR